MRKGKLFMALLAVLLGVTDAWAQQSNIFSASFKKGIPVQITNNRDKGFAIRLNEGSNTVNSGGATYTAEEIWYLVGNADGFRLYNHTAGKRKAVKLESNESGAAAIMVAENEATLLALAPQSDGSCAITPANGQAMSFNMFGGAGRDIKLYSSEDAGGHWNFKILDTNRPLKIEYNAQTEGAFDKIGRAHV